MHFTKCRSTQTRTASRRSPIHSGPLRKLGGPFICAHPMSFDGAPLCVRGALCCADPTEYAGLSALDYGGTIEVGIDNGSGPRRREQAE